MHIGYHLPFHNFLPNYTPTLNIHWWNHHTYKALYNTYIYLHAYKYNRHSLQEQFIIHKLVERSNSKSTKQLALKKCTDNNIKKMGRLKDTLPEVTNF